MTEQERDKAYAAAAGQIAGAVASAYFGPAAGAGVDAAVTAIAGAILSGDDDEVEKEIISKLDTINGKVDKILEFCNTGFKEIVDRSLNEKDIKDLVMEIDNDQIQLQTAMSAFAKANPPTEGDAQRLIAKAEETLSAGRHIFVASRDRYLIAIPYFALAFSALILVQQQSKKHVDAPAKWADRYEKDLTPWMTHATPGSFPEIRARLVEKLNVAKNTLKDLVAGQPVQYINFLVPTYEPGPELGDSKFSIPGNPVFKETMAYAAEYILHADFRISVRDLKVVSTVHRPVDVAEDMNAVFGVRSHPSFPPRIGYLRNDAYWHDIYTLMYENLQERAFDLRDIPPRLEALDFAIKVLDPLLAGMRQLALTFKWKPAIA